MRESEATASEDSNSPLRRSNFSWQYTSQPICHLNGLMILMNLMSLSNKRLQRRKEKVLLKVRCSGGE